MGASAGNQKDEKADRNVDRNGRAQKMASANEGCQETDQSPPVLASGRRFSSILSCNETFHEANLQAIDQLTTCNPSPWETEAGRLLGICVQSVLHNEFQFCLEYRMRSQFIKQNTVWK